MVPESGTHGFENDAGGIAPDRSGVQPDPFEWPGYAAQSRAARTLAWVIAGLTFCLLGVAFLTLAPGRSTPDSQEVWVKWRPAPPDAVPPKPPAAPASRFGFRLQTSAQKLGVSRPSDTAVAAVEWDRLWCGAGSVGRLIEKTCISQAELRAAAQARLRPDAAVRP
jgi:hypothetical protein